MQPGVGPDLWSIGHSNHPLDHFLALLGRHHVDVIADVRSQPYSRFNPQFSRDRLRAQLRHAGLGYSFLGTELGGRPTDHRCYDNAGHALYGRIARSEAFSAGLDRLLTGAARYRVAILCSEENPAQCHRHLLIARVLLQRGIDTKHIRADGNVQQASQLPGEINLFDLDEDPAWRSPQPIRSGSQATLPRSSSRR